MIGRLLLALAGALTLSSCGEPAREWPDPHPALWEVTGPDGAQGWLFGTIHSLPEGARWRTPAVDNAFGKASVLVVEVANLANDNAAAGAFQDISTTPGLPPLSQRVPAGDRPALAALLDRTGLDDGDFPDTETWAAALVIANRLRTGESSAGVDRALIADAGRVEGLESFKQQYGLFDSLSAEDQGDLLLAMAAEADSTAEERRVEAWLTGDMATLEGESAKGILADPELREVLQSRRNRIWASQVDRMMAAGQKPFVAVGAAHMLGAEALPALLTARGYTVRRVQ